MKKSNCIFKGVMVAAALSVSVTAQAQTYPVKPIKTIVTVAGGIDLWRDWCRRASPNRLASR